MPAQYQTVIIGAGLSGLACALELQNAGHKTLLLEASDAPGGRVRTDQLDGFLLDRGFQVYLDAYPTASQLLDLPALDLKTFEPGALVFHDQKLHRVMDVFRRPQHLLSSATAPIGTLLDKLRVALLRTRIRNSSLDTIANRPDTSTQTYLENVRFSPRFIDTFFRSFYGGIFLENELRTSSRMFEFTFKMFSHGSATLPAHGMQQIPAQLASRLHPDTLRLNTPVQTLTGTTLILENGEQIQADNIVLALPADSANKLMPDLNLPVPTWRSVTNLYFAAPQSPLNEPIIALNGNKHGLINNLSVPSDLSPHYAPEGQALISASILGLNESPDLPNQALAELASWFGPQVHQWKHLRTDLIPKALPDQLPNSSPPPQPQPPLFLCGDHQTSASIEGAFTSGQQIAKRILAAH
ncbi:MAG: NAD(P)/FAD-dependent oxidoreductase [Verrucomicrobiota bacterium]